MTSKATASSLSSRTTNIMTVDVEGWVESSREILPEHCSLVSRPIGEDERVVPNTRELMRIMAASGVRGTFFVLGTVAERYPHLVKEIHDGGHEVATHGYGHQLVYKMDPGEFKRDVERSVAILEGLIGHKVMGYRAPYASITPTSRWALDVLAETGLVYDASIFPIRRGLYGFPGAIGNPHIIRDGDSPLLEFPFATIKILGVGVPAGGGGYSRLLPGAYTRWAFRRINGLGQPGVFYMHPYELDSDELRTPLPDETARLRWVRITQNYHRDKTKAKLVRLLSEFEFTSVREWIELNPFAQTR